MVWKPAIFEQLDDLDKQDFPARLVDNIDLNIKAVSQEVYGGIEDAINTGGKIETYARILKSQHSKR